MAQTTVGEALNISPDAIKNITAAQKAIDGLATSTENFINNIGGKWGDLMHRMAQQAANMSTSVAADLSMHIPDAIQKMMNKMGAAGEQLGKMGSDFGKRFSESISVPTVGPARTAVDISDLVQALSKMTENGLTGVNMTKALEDQMNKLAAPIRAAADAIRKFAEAQTMLTRSDVTKIISDSSAEKIEKIKGNLSSLLTLYGRISSAQIVPNQSQTELDSLAERLKAVKKAIEEYHKEQAKKKSMPTFDEVIKNIEAHEGQLNKLKKDYKDLFDIMGTNNPSSKTFQEASVLAVKLEKTINALALKLKVLPMGMEDFQRAVKKVNPDGLRQLYWMLTEARDAAVKGSEAQQSYADKLNVVKRAMVDHVQAHRNVVISMDDLVKSVMNADVTLDKLKHTFSILQSMMSQTTWSKDFAGRLKPDMEGLESAISKVVVRMNEFHRAQQDVMTAASAVGANALQDISKKGVNNRNSVELERLANDLKTAMRYLDENSALWSEYRQRLSEVEAQQGKLDERMGRTEKSMRRTKEEVVYAAESLGFYQRELQRLNASAKVNTVGSSQWANDVKNISEYAANLDRAQRQTQSLTVSTESFKQKVAKMKDENAFRQMLTDMLDVRRAMKDSGADLDHVNDRIRMLITAWRDWNAEQNRPKGRTLDEISKSISDNHNNLAVLKKDYSDLTNIILSSDYGSKKFYDASAAAAALGSHIQKLESDERLLSQPLEQFNASLKAMDRSSLESLKTQLEGLRTAAMSVGAASYVVAEYSLRIDSVKKAIADLNATATKGEPPRTLRDIATDLNLLTRPLEETQKDYNLLLNVMSNKLPASNEFTQAAGLADKLAERIRVLTAEQDRYKRGMETMTAEIIKSYGGSTDGFKSMGMTEMEQTLGRIRSCMDGLSRTDMSTYNNQWNQLYKIWRDGNTELERMKTVQADLAAKFDFQKSSRNMADRANYANLLTSGDYGPAKLEELKALQSALRADIEKTADTTTKSTKMEVDAYHRVGKAISDIEKEINKVQGKTSTTTERSFNDIMRSVFSADASLKTLNADLAELQSKMQSVKLGDIATGEWDKAAQHVKNAVNEYGKWGSAIKYTNTQLQSTYDKLALIQRESQSVASASMGRWREDGFKGLEASIRNVTATSETLKRDLSDIQAIMDKTAKYDTNGKITKEWRQLEQLLGLVNKRMRVYNEEKNRSTKSMSVTDALKAAETAKSYNELTRALSRLKEIQHGMNPNTKYWGEINNAIKETEKRIETLKVKMGEVQKKSTVLRDGFMGLKNSMIAAFSISAITGYMKKMVEIHAQMRLQNVALRAILQNKDEADRIFMQVQQMALRSPFSIMQMTTYTKQLAAYRVEADKLVGTTKMLADVSAGLGVDMQRLILAYGQVKSANYLRATEVRQFTEAGLNIAGELANYFSELKGQMVTVGEVMDMISKRMVKFEDVEEVFKRVTSAGGLFYDMQKKQSDTVHGQLQRIKDAYTIMLDEIGAGNSGAISSVLTTLRELMANWRPFAVAIKDAAIAFGAYKVYALMSAIANSKWAASAKTAAISAVNLLTRLHQLPAMMRALRTHANLASIALKGLGMVANAVVGGVALYGIGLLIEKFYEWRTAGEAVAESLARIKEETQGESDKAVARYQTLAKAATDLTKSTNERKEALSELNRVYGEYLPKQSLEYDGIVKMAGAYDAVTMAIRQHYMEVEKANRVEYLKGEAQKIQQQLVAGYGDLVAHFGVSENEFDDIITRVIQKGLQAGYTNAHQYFLLLQDELKMYTGNLFTGTISLAGSLESKLGELASAYGTLEDAQNRYELKVEDVIEKQHALLASIFEGDSDLQLVFENSMQEGAKKGLDGVEKYITLFNSKLQSNGLPKIDFTQGQKNAVALWLEMQKASGDYEVNLDNLTQKENEFFTAQSATAKAQDDAFKQRIADINTLSGLYLLLKKNKDDFESNPENEGKDFWQTDGVLATIKEIQAAYDKLDLASPKSEDVKNMADQTGREIEYSCRELGVTSCNNFINGFKQKFPYLTTLFGGYVQKWQKQADEMGVSELEQNLKDAIAETETKYGEKNLFQQVRTDATSTAQTVGQEVKGMYEEYLDQLNRYAIAVGNGVDESLASLRIFGKGVTKEEVENKKEASKDLAQQMGVDLNKKTTGRQGTDPWVKRLELIKKANSEYEKLLKYYDAETSKSKIIASYAEAAREIFGKDSKWADISSWLGFDKAQTVANLKEIITAAEKGQIKVKEDTLKRLKEDMGTLQAEIDIKVQEDALEQLKTDVEEIFDRFDLTKTFNELGVGDNMMERLFGKQPLATIDALRKEFDKLAKQAKAQNLFGDDYEKWYAERMKKISDLELKQMQEQTKNYIKYTKEAMSERGRIIMEAFQEQNRIMQDTTLDDATKKLAMEQSAKKMNESLAKQNWEDFKGSDMYIRMFESLDYASDKAIADMIARLNQLKESWKGLPPDQMKAMVKELEKLRGEQRSRNPFGELAESYREVQKLKKAGKSEESLERDFAFQTQLEQSYTNQITELETVVGLRQTLAQGGAISAEYEHLRAKYAEQSDEAMADTISKLNAMKNANAGNLSQTEEQLDTYRRYKEALKSAEGQWGQYMQAAKQAGDTIKGVLEAAGVEMDSVGGIVADTILNLIDMAGQLVLQIALWNAMGVAVKSAMGPIGWGLIALQAVASVFTAIFNIGDKQKQKQIDALKDRVDALSKAYDRLKEKIESAYKLNDYRLGTQQAEKSIQQQIDAYQAMIKLEEDKKKTDKSALKEYKNAIEDLKKELVDLKNEQTKSLGGFGSDGRLDAAKSFVDAWLKAFKETGDGLDALQGQWDDYIESLLKTQAAYRIAGRRLEAFFDQVDAMANAHSELSLKSIFDQVQQMQGNITENLSKELEEWFSYFGWNGTGDLLLSDLQKGIQNITESQAAALESIMNSMRFAEWRQVDLLTEIAASVANQYTGNDGASLDVLKGIRDETAEIRSLLTSVIRRSGTPDGRPSIRVM